MSAPLGGGLIATVRAALDISDFTKNASKMAMEAKKVAREIKKMGREVADMALGVNAAIAAAVIESSKFSYGMEQAVKKNKVALENLSIAVGNLVLPAFKELTRHTEQFVGWLQSLTAEQRANIGSFVAHAAVILTSVAAFAKFVSVGAAIARVFASLVPIILSIGAPLLIGVAAFAALVLAAGFFYHRVKPYFADIANAAREAWAKIWEFFQPVFDALGTAFDFLKDMFFTSVEAIAKGLDSVAAKLGKNLGAFDALQAFRNAAGSGSALDRIKSLGVKIGDALKGGFNESIQGLKEMFHDMGLDKVFDELSKKFGLNKLGAKAPPMQDQRQLELQGSRERIDTFGESMSEANMALFDKMLEEHEARNRDSSAFLKQTTAAPNLNSIHDKTLAEEAAKRLKEVIDGITSKLLGSLGRFGGAVETFMKGFKDGGIWGALIETIIYFISESQIFKDVIGMLEVIFQELADMFGQLIKFVEPVLGAIQDLISKIIKVLGPLLAKIGSWLQGLAAIIEVVAAGFNIVGGVLKALGPLLDLFGRGLMGVFRGLFAALKYVTEAVGYVVYGIMSAWNGIMDAISSIVKTFGGDTSKLQSMKLDTGAVFQGIQQLDKVTWDSAMAQATATGQTLKFAAAMGNATGIMNAPDGFKVTLERWRAMAADNGTSTPDPSGTQPVPGVTPGTHGARPVGPITINVHGVTDPDAVANKIAGAIARVRQRRSGVSDEVAPRYGV